MDIANRNIFKKYVIINDSTLPGPLNVDLDEFVYEKELGQGKYGNVSRHSLKDHPNMKFAIKRLSIRYDLENQESELVRDIKILNTIGDSPFTIKFFGAMFADVFLIGDYWIVTECMDSSLDEFYKVAHEAGIQITELFLSKVACTILKAMQFLKEKKVIHRDIKPSNMLINVDGTIKLCDFGMSGFLNNSQATTFSGAQSYMSPEKISQPEDGFTIKSDIWSLGISLIEIAEGVHPYAGCSSNILAVVLTIIEGPAPHLPADKYSNDFNTFINSCLVKDPENRGGLNLLEFNFIKSYQSGQLDLDFIKLIIEKKFVKKSN